MDLHDGPPEFDPAERRVTLSCAPGSRIAVLIDGVEAYSTLDGPVLPATPGRTTVRTLLQKLFTR
jgi:hypothetical protein